MTVVAFAAIATLLTGPALAGKGGKGGGRGQHDSTEGGASLVLNDPDPHFGELVTFTASYDDTIKEAFIRVECFQSGELVYGEGGRVDATFKLGGDWSKWVENGGGEALCRAGLYYFEGNGRDTAQTWLYWTEDFLVAG